MKVYLVCTLNDEYYREPYFYFFKTAFAAHKWVIDNLVSIAEESREEVMSELEYKNVDGSDDQIIRIAYSFGDGEFYVNTIHEIEIEDGNYLCIYHHAYDGVGFYVEKIGTLEQCRNQMLDSAAKVANDYDIDITNDDIFEVNFFDSCVDDDNQWHMCDIVQFKISEIMYDEKQDNSTHKYNDEVYKELKNMYEPLPMYGCSPNHAETSLEEVIEDIDARPKYEVFKELCNYHGIAPSTVEYLYESIWGKPKNKTVGYFKI